MEDQGRPILAQRDPLLENRAGLERTPFLGGPGVYCISAARGVIRCETGKDRPNEVATAHYRRPRDLSRQSLFSGNPDHGLRRSGQPRRRRGCDLSPQKLSVSRRREHSSGSCLCGRSSARAKRLHTCLSQRAVRFKLDENLPVEASERLREAGYDAMSVLDQGLGGAPDRDLAAVCVSEGRALLTFDTDFANIRAYPPGEHAGLIVFRLPAQDKGSLLSVLERLIRVLSETSPRGRLWIVERDRIRIRE